MKTNKQKTIKLKRKIPTLRSLIQYDGSIARTYHDISYYEGQQSEIQSLPEKKERRRRLASRQRPSVTKFIEDYKSLIEQKAQGVFNKLAGIYNKNKTSAFGNLPPPINSNLLYIASSVPMLVIAYTKIRKNKGAMTLAWTLSQDKYNKLNAKQKMFLNQTLRLPDGISRDTFITASKLLRSGKYPWGSSRRIYVKKPGKPGALRPITIPPFMDRVVQGAICMVLEAIYEPWLEKQNCSFGFRPRKGVHDAIFSLTNWNTRGLHQAIEGDIKSAYDKVCREKLITILGKTIKDRKFLDLLSQRLKYQFWDSEQKKYIEETEGLPQGGIDSPYLWNIYMMEFDRYVINETTKMFDALNKKVRGNATLKRLIPPPERRKLQRHRATLRWIINLINRFPTNHEVLNRIFNSKERTDPDSPHLSPPKELLGWKALLKKLNWKECYDNRSSITQFKYRLIQENRRYVHATLSLPPSLTNKKHLRFRYARYADDWILLTNAPISIVQELKQKYKEFLSNELHATLAEDKTLITDMRKQPAHFLGFELHTYAHNRISRINIKRKGKTEETTIKSNTGKSVFTLPDRQRLISRLHMKRYCTKTGAPREIPWLSCLEPYIIIERFNAVLRGHANYYTEFVKSPPRSLGRWLYIVRYSCLKTLAQKFKTSIAGIFKRFSHKRPRKSKDMCRTISCSVVHVIDGKRYKKTWKLLTPKDVIQAARKTQRINNVSNTFWALEKGHAPVYKSKEGGLPPITQDTYLDKIKWVNLRTQASLDSPCLICGSEEMVQMHHIKHIRKQRYEFIPTNKPWEKIMSDRNRKQIPACRECHMNVIHKGKYGGTRLNLLAPKVMYDNRLIVLETHLNPRAGENFTKTLQEKGWVELDQQKDKVAKRTITHPSYSLD